MKTNGRLLPSLLSRRPCLLEAAFLTLADVGGETGQGFRFLTPHLGALQLLPPRF